MRLQDWEGKAFYGQYLRQTEEASSEQSQVWLQSGDLKKQTESLIVATQNQSIKTNFVKAKIDKIQKDMLYRLCQKADDVSGCSKLGQNEYKRRHHNLKDSTLETCKRV